MSDSITFRLYFYNVDLGYQPDSYDVYNTACREIYSTVGGTFLPAMGGYSAGLLGYIVSVPEPTTLAFAAISGLGLLLFRPSRRIAQ